MPAVTNLINLYNKINVICPNELAKIHERTPSKDRNVQKIVESIVLKAPKDIRGATFKNLILFKKPSGFKADVKNFFHGIGCKFFSWAGVKRHKELTHFNNAIALLKKEARQVDITRLPPEKKVKIQALQKIFDGLVDHVNKKEILVDNMTVPIAWKGEITSRPQTKSPNFMKELKKVILQKKEVRRAKSELLLSKTGKKIR
jgi:hypothetical protein